MYLNCNSVQPLLLPCYFEMALQKHTFRVEIQFFCKLQTCSTWTKHEENSYSQTEDVANGAFRPVGHVTLVFYFYSHIKKKNWRDDVYYTDLVPTDISCYLYLPSVLWCVPVQKLVQQWIERPVLRFPGCPLGILQAASTWDTRRSAPPVFITDVQPSAVDQLACGTEIHMI